MIVLALLVDLAAVCLVISMSSITWNTRVTFYGVVVSGDKSVLVVFPCSLDVNCTY